MKSIFKILEFEMTTPVSYGWFHIMFLILVLSSTILISIFFKDCKDKTFRIICLSSWIIMVVFEIYKQTVFTYTYSDAGLTADYAWYAFPYQLCSTPIYILPFIAFMKESYIRDFFTSYIATFAFFGGIVVFVYPNDVFCSTLGVNIQTMVHHGLQVILGVYILVREQKKINVKYFLKALTVFSVMVSIAVIINEAVYSCFIKQGIDDTFNMFYISRHFPVHLPILSTIYELVPYIVYLFAYIIGFSIAAILILCVAMALIKLFHSLNSKREILS